MLNRRADHGIEVMHAIAMANVCVAGRRLIRVKRLAEGAEMAMPGIVVGLRMKRIRIDGQKQGGEEGQHLTHP